MGLNEKLMLIQSELKAPKSQTNAFGKYKYRNCEDILEAVKPLLLKYKCALTISDTLEQIGERYYIKANVTLFDTESEIVITNTSYAREEENKKGMDGSQVTGASSSYARKYALNGLFAIDDTADSDTTNTGEKPVEKPVEKPKPTPQQYVSAKQKEKNVTNDELFEFIGEMFGKNALSECTKEECTQIYEWLQTQ